MLFQVLGKNFKNSKNIYIVTLSLDNAINREQIRKMGWVVEGHKRNL